MRMIFLGLAGAAFIVFHVALASVGLKAAVAAKFTIEQGNQ